MIQSGDVIRHKTFKDVCCLVQVPGSNMCMIEWVNMGYVKSWSLGHGNMIEIKNPNDWEICLDPDPICYRYAAWRQLGV